MDASFPILQDRSFNQERAAIDSTDPKDAQDAYFHLIRARDAIPRTDRITRSRADIVAGQLKERLSVFAYLEGEGARGREHNHAAKNHHYWADEWQRRITENQREHAIAHYHRSTTLFHRGRIMILESLLDLLPIETHPEAYAYLSPGARTHDGIVRHLYDVVQQQTPVTLDARIIQNGFEGARHLIAMDTSRKCSIELGLEPARVHRLIERVRRGDRIATPFLGFIRYLAPGGYRPSPEE